MKALKSVVLILFLLWIYGQSQDINYAEYFIDLDPGLGDAAPLSIPSGDDIEFTFTPDISALSAGFHTLYIRCRTTDGKWSVTEARAFYKSDESVSPPLPGIAYAEYFIDLDPGLGDAAPLSIPSGDDIEFTFTPDISALSAGFHTLYIRCRTTDGKWNVMEARAFYKTDDSVIPPLPEIVFLEYFIDLDPGHGHGTELHLPDSSAVVEVAFSVDITGLREGFHTLYLRSRDRSGTYAIHHAHPFFVPYEPSADLPPELRHTEYFIDQDPGYGKCTPLPVPGAPDTSVSFAVNLDALSGGFHTLYLRSLNEDHSWAVNYAHPFFKRIEIEPEFPGIRSICFTLADGRQQSPVYAVALAEPDSSIEAEFFPDLTSLMEDSTYVLRVFGVDSTGSRSLDYVHEFRFMPDLAFTIYNFEFDSVAVGDSSSFTIPLYAFEDSLEITGITMSGGVHCRAWSEDVPGTLNTGDSVQIHLVFKPKSTGVLRDTLLVTDSRSESPSRLFIRGIGKSATGIAVHSFTPPKTLVLRQNFPNPFNPATTIKYELPDMMDVEITIVNILGQVVRRLVHERQQSGYYTVTWNGTNDYGSKVPSGVYLYRIQAGKTVRSFKMVLIK